MIFSKKYNADKEGMNACDRDMRKLDLLHARYRVHFSEDGKQIAVNVSCKSSSPVREMAERLLFSIR